MRISDWSSDVCSSDLRVDLAKVPLLDALGDDVRYVPDDLGVIVHDTLAGLPGQRPHLAVQDTAFLAHLVVVVDQASNDADEAVFRGQPTCERVADVAANAIDHPPIDQFKEIGRAHVRTPVTNAQLECRLMLEKKT